MTINHRVPHAPDGVTDKNTWRAGYIACLSDLDAGRLDRPSKEEVKAAAEWGFTVENYFNGTEYVAGSYVVVDYEGEVHGGVMDTRHEAEAEAVARWREDTRFD